MKTSQTFSRSVTDPIEMNRLGQTPLITSLVLGMPQSRVKPSQLILPRITVPSINFKYPIFGSEHLRRRDTRRALRAQINRGSFTVTYDTAKLTRYTFADEADIAEFSDALPTIGLREKKAAFGRIMVENDIEATAATLLATATTYPVGNRLALGAGDEWGASGNVYDDIHTVAKAISDATAGLIAPAQLSAYMPTATIEAAYNDAEFRAASVYGGTARANKSKLVEYLGIKEIITGNPITETDAGVRSPLYGDITILFFNDSNSGDLIQDFGGMNFGASFSLNSGVALEPFYDPDHTTWVFPWEDWVEHKITNSSMGGIITNCAP